MSSKIYYFIIWIVFFYAIFLRYYWLWYQSFWIDEGFSSIVSYYASLHHFIPILPSWNYDFSQYFFTLLQGISFKLFWYNDFSARFPSFLISIFFLILWYFFIKDVFKDEKYWNLGIIFIFFVFSFLTWNIVWAHQARFYELLAFFYLLILFLLYKYYKTKNSYFLYTSFILTGLWAFFHPFILAFFIVEAVYLIYLIWKDYLLHKKFSTKLKYIFFFLSGVLIYFWLKFLINYVSWHWAIIPWTYNLPSFYKQFYVNFYSNVLVFHLSLFVIAFILLFFYWIFKNKWELLIIVALTFIINFYVISQKWFLMHSRYVYHLFSIIIIFWWYALFIFFKFIYEKYWKNVFLSVFIIFALFSLYTVKLTFLPSKKYFIDYTSPQPDFKWAYNFIKNQKIQKPIITWFPHLCIWYNLNNKNICKYALMVNFVWDATRNKFLMKKKVDRYTWIPYIDNIKDYSKYYFVLDDLTIKWALQQDIIKHIFENCQIIYSLQQNNKKYNFIWVFDCK